MIFKDQATFMKAGHQTVGAMNEGQQLLYQILIDEEYKEFKESTYNEPLRFQIKEAVDVMVVVAGWLHSVGIEPEQAWNAVHENNMLKVEHPPVKDSNGKIRKSAAAMKGKVKMLNRLQELIDD